MTNIRRMPEPWFSANAYNSPICEIYERNRERKALPGERQLGRFLLPPFQRPPVWTRDQQVKLLESIWSGMPIGAYVYNRTAGNNSRFDEWLLDGQQRITAILAYVADEFSVFGLRYSELWVGDRRHFDMTPLPCLQSNIDTEAGCREVYERLAYGGTHHVAKEDA